MRRIRFANPMKTFVSLLVVFVHLLVPAIAAEARKSVKLLTIGNSFANDATFYLPEIAQAAGKDLLIFKANPGGCSLQRHAGAMQAYELNPQDPKGQLYGPGFVPPRPGGKKTHSLQEALRAEKWDFVTIQQLSNDSFKYETFEPYAKSIIDCIRANAPQAEILVHRTWAYREDYPGFADGTFAQQMMFEGLVSAYGKLSDAYHLRVIPVGTAIQAARSTPRWKFTFPDPDFNYTQPVLGTNPKQLGSLNVGWKVITSAVKATSPDNIPEPVDQPTPGNPAAAPGAPAAPAIAKEAEKTTKAVLDFKHCNADGRYLGALVFYGFIFGEKPSSATFVPQLVKPEDAILLRGIADETLAGAAAKAALAH